MTLERNALGLKIFEGGGGGSSGGGGMEWSPGQ